MRVFDLEGNAAAAPSAAQGNLAEQGYYAPVKSMQGAHEMSVSFRGKEDVCPTPCEPCTYNSTLLNSCTELWQSVDAPLHSLRILRIPLSQWGVSCHLFVPQSVRIFIC